MDPKPDLSSLRIVFVSGSQLGAGAGHPGPEGAGPGRGNLYGSTEIAFASIARPEDLQKNPATVGPVVKGRQGKDPRRQRQGGAAGRGRPDLRRQHLPVRGLHRRRWQADHRRPAVLRGRGLLRPQRTALRQRPRRRDDRLRRRERLSRRSGRPHQRPPDVVEATAVGVEDKDFGARLRAFVVPRDPKAEVTEDAIKNYVREHLARYKVPRRSSSSSELPRNPTGKILKRELRQIEVK